MSKAIVTTIAVPFAFILSTDLGKIEVLSSQSEARDQEKQG